MIKSYKDFNNFSGHDFLGFFNQSSVDNGGVSGGRSVAVGVSDMVEGRW